MKIAYITDSGIGKTKEELAENGIISLPLVLMNKDKSYNDMEELDKEGLINLLKDKEIIKTSQPSYGLILDQLTSLKDKGYDYIFTVPICPGLSGTLDSITSAAKSLGLGITSINTYVTAVIQEYLIKNAKSLFESGKTFEEIKNIFSDIISSANTLLIPNDLSHLKRGGRLTPLAYSLAELLKIVPILKINKETDGKIDVISKVRTYKRAEEKLLDIMKNEVKDNYLITVAHVDALEKAKDLSKKLEDIFPTCKIQVIKLCNVVAAHTGLDCLAVQYFKLI